MPASSAISPVNSTLGVVFLCTLFISVLFGVTNVQTYFYYSRSKHDRALLRWTIFALWLLDALHFALFTHRVYWELITHFGDWSPLLPPGRGVISVWSIVCWCVISTVSDFLVRMVFATRAWQFSQKSTKLAVALGIAIVFVLGTGLAFPIEVSATYKNPTLPKYSWLILAYLASIVVADSLIAGSLCVLLWRSRTGVKQTDSMLRILMLYSVNTGLLTSLFAAMGFITYVTAPQKLVYIFFLAALPKLYFNALLANLNARQSLRDQSACVVESSASPTDTCQAGRLSFRKDTTSQLGGARQNTAHNQITIDAKTVVDSEVSTSSGDNEWRSNV